MVTLTSLMQEMVLLFTLHQMHQSAYQRTLRSELTLNFKLTGCLVFQTVVQLLLVIELATTKEQVFGLYLIQLYQQLTTL